MQKNNRRLLLIAVVLLFVYVSSGQAQEYKPFRVALGTGMIIPSTKFEPGILLYVEPAWRFSRKMSVGLRIETAAKFNADISIIGSYSINTQYYFFTSRKVHFFGGIGVGIFTPNHGLGATCSCEGEAKSTVAGFYPRLGFDYRHMIVSAEYNFSESVKRQAPYADLQAVYYYNASTSYLAFKIGFFIGRRRE